MKVSDFLKKHPKTAEQQARFEEAIPERRQIRLTQEYYSCACCGGQVAYESQVDWESQTVDEKGACRSCGGEVEERRFRLQ